MVDEMLKPGRTVAILAVVSAGVVSSTTAGGAGRERFL